MRGNPDCLSKDALGRPELSAKPSGDVRSLRIPAEERRPSPAVVPLRDRCLREIVNSCPDSEERTGIRFEKERVYGYSGGAKALPGRPLAPAIAPIRGSRR